MSLKLLKQNFSPIFREIVTFSKVNYKKYIRGILPCVKLKVVFIIENRLKSKFSFKGKISKAKCQFKVCVSEHMGVSTCQVKILSLPFDVILFRRITFVTSNYYIALQSPLIDEYQVYIFRYGIIIALLPYSVLTIHMFLIKIL